MSATAVAIATSTGAVAYAVEKQHDEECLKVIQSYDTKTATIQQMQEYSGCVNRLYPAHSALSGEAIIAIKILLVLSIVWGVVIGVKEYRYYKNLSNAILMSFFSAIVAGLVLIVFVLLINFLFLI